MKRHKLFFVSFFLISSLFMVVYLGPGTRIEVDPLEPVEFMYKANTKQLTVTPDSSFAYSISIFGEQDNYSSSISTKENQTGSLDISLPNNDIYFIVLESSSVGSLKINSVGIPPIYLGYMIVLGISTLGSFFNWKRLLGL